MLKTLLTLISAVALAFLVACGGSSNHISVPPASSGGNPVGFGNASLNGNYVFAVNGIDQSSNYNFAVAGVFTANGSGTITSGTRDTVTDTGAQTTSESITGTYSVGQDGRGQLVLNGSSGRAIYYFVLSSPTAGKLFQDGAGQNSVIFDATGRLEAQSTPSTSLTGTYIVRLDGEDTNKYAYGAVGGLTAGGSTLTGSIDENDAGTPNLLLPVSSGSYSLSSSGRGTATYTTASGTTNTAPHNFVVYYVSPSRLELVSIDPKFFLHGYANLQSGAVGALTGGQVFNIAGYSGNGIVGETGSFTLGSGTITIGVEDYNDDGDYVAKASFGAGAYTVSGTGRWTATLNSSLGDILVGWQVSPQQSLVLAYNGATTLLETGEVRAQTLTGLSNASVSGVNYAQSFSGYSTNVFNFESTGSFVGNSGGGLAGTIDYQTDSNGLTINSAQTGLYSVDSTTGRGSGNISGVPVVFYTVDAGDIYMIAADSNRLYQGTLTSQTP